MNAEPDPSTQPARVIHVPRRFVQEIWGGTETVILNLCRQQMAMGEAPEIYTSTALKEIREEIWRDIAIRRFPYFYTYFGLSDDQRKQFDLSGGNLVSPGLLRGLLGAKNVRLFHAHAINRLGSTVLTAARMRRLPCVTTIHGNVFDVPRDEASARQHDQPRLFDWGKPVGLLLQTRRFLEKVDAVICVGHSEYEAARKQLSHDRVHYLPNGVDPTPFVVRAEIREEHRKRLGFSSDDFVFGCISRVDPQKDQGSLIDAFAKLARINPRVQLVIAGPATSSQYEKSIRGKIQALHLGNRLQLLPPVQAESTEHSGLMSALDTFVLPSRHEPFGIVVLEAWAAGKPVIASDIGGLRRLIDHNRNGLKTPAQDPDSLSEAMRALVDNPTFAGQLAESGRATMLAEYTWEKINGRQEKIYGQASERARR